MSYKRDAASNRDALFGPSSGSSSSSSKTTSGPKHKRNAQSNRDALFAAGTDDTSKKSSGKKKPSSKASSNSDSRRRTTTAEPTTATTTTTMTARGYSHNHTTSSSSNNDTKHKKSVTSVLSGTAKVQKLQEAEDYRDKAKKAMQRGLLSRPDPIAAGLLYKRAADAYQQCGENRLERLHRIASADLQLSQGTYATAAAEYTRVAVLVQESEEPIQRKRMEGCKTHSDAANAYLQMGERGKAAASKVESALALLWGDDTSLMDREALTALEEAVEAHVPDVLNRYGRYRQTGISAYADPDVEGDSPSPENMALAKEMMVRKAYAHEPLQKMVTVFCRYGEFASALYAAGAASTILEEDGISTLTLSRSYVVETILLLAMGDPIAARQYFLQVHVQKDFYLTSRECKLAEELFTAVLGRDKDALDEARSPSGSNRAALSNLDGELRTLVQQLRASGVARRQVASTAAGADKGRTAVDDELDKEIGVLPATTSSKTTTMTKPAKEETDNSSGGEEETEEEEESEEDDVARQRKSEALQSELDGLGLDSDDDSDIDLR